MDESFLKHLRRDPDPDFSRDLGSRLRSLERAQDAPRSFRWRPVFAAALALAVCGALFTLPAVRATAQQMIDLFRVRDFAVVPVDAARMEQLRAQKFDPRTLLGGKVEKLQDFGPPQSFTTIEAAAAAAGFGPLRPGVLPRAMRLDSVLVCGELRERVTVDTQPLRSLMDAFDVRDLSVPPGLDGQVVSIHVPRVMVQKYGNGRGARAAFVQTNGPEVSLPPGVDLARLGEIGLRLMGLKPGEASRMARSIDWRSTLLVPVSSNATTFQQITVNGVRGVYLESTSTRTPDGADRGPGAVVMWSRDGRVYALMGNLDQGSIVTMAESVR